jgi:hypothetical protein
MMVPGCHFLLVGGCRETGIFRQDPPLPATGFTSTNLVATGTVTGEIGFSQEHSMIFINLLD